MHDKPGGMCTAWKRRGYTFDGCMHNVVGTGTASKVHRIWDELGALQSGVTTTLPRLENFYMVGQWAGATIGISTVAIMGRNLIQRICKRDRRRFITNKLSAGSGR